jgi:hypothetical protein
MARKHKKSNGGNLPKGLTASEKRLLTKIRQTERRKKLRREILRKKPETPREERLYEQAYGKLARPEWKRRMEHRREAMEKRAGEVGKRIATKFKGALRSTKGRGKYRQRRIAKLFGKTGKRRYKWVIEPQSMF